MNKDEWRARFEQLGPEQVRTMMQSGGILQHQYAFALEWLAEKDQDFARQKEASKSEQVEIARSAKDAAWAAARAAERAAIAAENANKRATIALIIAAISIAVTLYTSWVSHTESVRSQATTKTL